MAIIKCKMCGGDMVISDDKTYGTCEYCGSQMTLPKISDDQRAAAFNRGNHFRRIGEFDKALQVYERIVREDEKDAEAHWCCALCRFGIEYVEDPASFEYIPTCHRASFDNFLEDVDYLAAVEHSDGITRRQYQKDGAKIAEVQRGILATSQNEEPYDVFICYKETDENGERTRDSAMAQDIYYQLTEQGRRVFFARITLEDKVGTEYEPYIFAALHSARVMVVVGTSAENLNAVWVKNEWSRFLTMMKHDRNKLLLPCYRDMDPYDLPEQLGVLQSYDMSKIGFIQDLTRGISKVLDADKQPEPIKETVVVQQTGGSNADALLKRGYMALEDGEWEQASDFFEDVLNQNAECASAYLGKTLAANKASNLQRLAEIRLETTENADSVVLTIPEDRAHVDAAIAKYKVPAYLTADEITKLYAYDLRYRSYIKARKIQRTQEESHWNEHRNMNRALQFAGSELSAEIRKCLADIYQKMDQRTQKVIQEEADSKRRLEERYAAFLKSTDQKVEELHQKAIMRRQKDAEAHTERQRRVEEEKKKKYDSLCRLYSDSEDVKELRNAAAELDNLEDYYESKVYAAKCTEKADRIEAAEKLRQEETAKISRSKHKKKMITIGLIASACIVFVIVLNTVIIPGQKLKKVNSLLNAGDYETAYEMLEEMERSDLITDNKYSRAMALIESENYDDAYALLEEIGRSEVIDENKYNRADALLETGDYISAYKLLECLDFKDSEIKRKEITPQYYKALYKDTEIGDEIFFGTYEQDNIISNGTEAICWYVLDKKDDKILLISKNILDFKAYNTTHGDITWEECSLRKWLNDDFINTSFSKEERMIIPTVTISAEKNPEYLSNPGNDTRDRFFLLSISEATRYLTTDNMIMSDPTPYALTNKKEKWGQWGSCSWWLRSPGQTQEFADIFFWNADRVSYGMTGVGNAATGIRPAFWLDIQ